MGKDKKTLNGSPENCIISPISRQQYNVIINKGDLGVSDLSGLVLKGLIRRTLVKCAFILGMNRFLV